MRKHILTIEQRKKVDELKFSEQYESCAKYLASIIDKLDIPSETDEKYEFGAAILELAVFCRITGDVSAFRRRLQIASEILPEEDKFALLAKCFYLYGKDVETANKYCDSFFIVADAGFRERDSISKYYYESVKDIKKKLF